MGPGGWMSAYDDFRKALDAREPTEGAMEDVWEHWLSFHFHVDSILGKLGQSLWLPLVDWLSEGDHHYPAAQGWDLAANEHPPPLILIPAGPALDVLPLSALAYDDPRGLGRHVAADDYQIVHAPTFRLLKHSLDRRASRADISRRLCLSAKIDAPDLFWLAAIERHLVRQPYPDLELAENGSRKEICRKLPRRDVCIINGHASFDAAAPLRSSLELSDGHLYLMDITRMDLTRVELLEHLGCEVVLGAWNNHASGMAGFAGSLMAAGAGSVLGSVWCRETSIVSVLLINRLHEELAGQSGPLSPGRALWRASAWLRTAELDDLEKAATNAADSAAERERALSELHDVITQDFGAFSDTHGPPLRRARHWAGLIAYGSC